MNSHNKDTSLDLSAFLDGELSPEKTAELAERIKQDTNLSDELETISTTRDLLGSLPRKTAPEGFSDDVMERVERDRLLKVNTQSRRRASPLWIRAGASAAIVLITGGLLMYVADVFREDDWVSLQDRKQSAERISITADTTAPPSLKVQEPEQVKKMLLDDEKSAEHTGLKLSLKGNAPLAVKPDNRRFDMRLAAKTDSSDDLARRRSGATPGRSLAGGKVEMLSDSEALASIAPKQPPMPEGDIQVAPLAAEPYGDTNISSPAATAEVARLKGAKIQNGQGDDLDREFILSQQANLPLDLQQMTAQSVWANTVVMRCRVNELLDELPDNIATTIRQLMESDSIKRPINLTPKH